ncbi:hypothetical protein HKX48_003691 [Thoreauomyces humboldtii]|nr:hypothetical protein HKX48_003691 [Thoreauomyces humboldtii]
MAPYFSLLELVERADSFPRSRETQILLTPSPTVGLPLLIGQTVVGFIRPALVPIMVQHSNVFTMTDAGIQIHASLDTPAARTVEVEIVLRSWKDFHRGNSLFACLEGWRNERYSVHGKPEEGVLMDLERAAAGLLGARAYGCHLNGYVRDRETGEIRMWCAKRSDAKQTYPGMLDNLVGGGLATTTTPYDNIVKECGEEAGLSPETVKRGVVATGVLSFFLEDEERGWVPDTEYVYDLELDDSFRPKPVDGEVQAFYLWSLHEVKEHLHRGEFMNESGLVIIDFLIRKGFVTAMNEPDYVEIVSRMHRHLAAPGPRFGLP